MLGLHRIWKLIHTLLEPLIAPNKKLFCIGYSKKKYSILIGRDILCSGLMLVTDDMFLVKILNNTLTLFDF